MARYFGVPLRNGLPIGLGSSIGLGGAGGPPAPISDEYFEYTTLLLPGNGTNGAQNNTFLDSSTNNFTITRNGNTTQGTFSPFSQTGWGNYFDGSGDYLSVADNAALQMGSGDFTIEYWWYPTSLTGYQSPIDKGYTGAGALLLQTGNGDGKIIVYAAGSVVITASTAVTANAWNHMALVRSGTSLVLYLNGTSVGSATNSTNFNSAATLGVGSSVTTAVLPVYGYMSNVRIVKGTAVYTSSFTPSTTPLTAITNTSLLTCQSNRFVDNSTNAFAITRNGDVSVQAFSPFNPTAAWSAATNGGSGYFDGSGDYLTLADNAALEPGSSDLTWEMWINTTSSVQYATLYSRTTASFSTSMWSLMINYASATAGDIALFVGDYSTGSPLLATSGANIRDNAWHHIAVVRNGSSWVIYVDGVSRATNTWSGTILDQSQGPYIGRDQFYGRDFSGYISGLRIVKGTAVYTAGFTPPTAPPTAITNTSLLLNYTNAGIYDATSKNDLETVGNAQISTAQSKFGGSSMYFDGTGDWLLAPDNALYAYGTGDFTVEAWVYINSFPGSGSAIIIDQRESTPAGGGFSLEYTTTGRLDIATGSVVLSSSSNLSTGTWQHVAMSRYGSTLRLFINGAQVGSASNSTSLTSQRLTIGAYTNRGGGSVMNGYIDDLRITKGIARYTSNFTPPTAAFPLL